jgi:hypothetical protein
LLFYDGKCFSENFRNFIFALNFDLFVFCLELPVTPLGVQLRPGFHLIAFLNFMARYKSAPSPSCLLILPEVVSLLELIKQMTILYIKSPEGGNKYCQESSSILRLRDGVLRFARALSVSQTNVINFISIVFALRRETRSSGSKRQRGFRRQRLLIAAYSLPHDIRDRLAA